MGQEQIYPTEEGFKFYYQKAKSQDRYLEHLQIKDKETIAKDEDKLFSIRKNKKFGSRMLLRHSAST